MAMQLSRLFSSTLRPLPRWLKNWRKPSSPPKDAAKEPEVNSFFRMVMEHEASDLHLKVGQPPMMHGDVRRMKMSAHARRYGNGCRSRSPTQAPQDFDEHGADFLRHRPGRVARVSLFRRCVAFAPGGRPPGQQRHPQLRRPGSCRLPLNRCATTWKGWSSSPRDGQRQSTTIASMIDYDQRGKEPLHILTVEDPIEFTTDKSGLTSIVPRNRLGYAIGTRPSRTPCARTRTIILIGDAARRGDRSRRPSTPPRPAILVFGTIHAASSGTATINRILDLFPPEKHGAIRQALANNLKAVVAQKLDQGT